MSVGMVYWVCFVFYFFLKVRLFKVQRVECFFEGGRQGMFIVGGGFMPLRPRAEGGEY